MTSNADVSRPVPVALGKLQKRCFKKGRRNARNSELVLQILNPLLGDFH